MATQPIDYTALAKKYGAVSSQPAGGVDYNALAKKYGAVSSQPPAQQKKPGFFDDPQGYLQNRATDLENEAQRQHNLANGPESQGKSYISRVGHEMLSAVPATAAFVDKAASGLFDPKMSAAMGAGLFDPAIPAAYFMTQGTKGLAETAPKIASGNASPNDVQDALSSAAMLVGGPAAAMSPKAGTAMRSVSEVSPVTAVRNAYETRATKAARATVPEAANLPTPAVIGVEKIYRASAPVGSDPGFRTNLYKAAGDLAEIGRAAKSDLANAKGGVIQPDMRVRATVNAANDHLAEMYKNERAPQIERNAENPVQTNFGADASEGLEYLSRKAGNSELRTLAQKALDGDHMTLADMDRLERLNSAELRNYNGMTAQDRAGVEQTNPKIGALKPLDKELNAKIGKELASRGEVGIREYGQRYAAVSSVRDQLQSRMNAVELDQPGVIKAAIKPAVNALTGGKSGIASASQAAVADVNIGRQLQQGLQHLADSGIKANRGTPGTAPSVRGLLPAQSGGPFAMPEAPLGTPVANYGATQQPTKPLRYNPYGPTGRRGVRLSRLLKPGDR
jgi:hypothetical protein